MASTTKWTKMAGTDQFDDLRDAPTIHDIGRKNIRRVNPPAGQYGRADTFAPTHFRAVDAVKHLDAVLRAAKKHRAHVEFIAGLSTAIVELKIFGGVTTDDQNLPE